MPRTKATFNSVDLTRAMKAARDAGLTISFTQIDPNGRIILGYGQAAHEPEDAPDDVLLAWETRRRLS